MLAAVGGDQVEAVDGEGVPDSTAVPTALPTTEGPLPTLIFIPNPGVTHAEVLAFTTRHRSAARDETARAADSQIRWSLEPDGLVHVRSGSRSSSESIS
ncbi:hypothetical protein [Streptomyces solaniscabiei]|uniref:hypothetical protein n=1 Tax=Streptomyces solaniscabiei TaxID=2683255 RepID=UPI001CE27548|nr:hypothetical protein [Streptomyces solaniscabiei]